MYCMYETYLHSEQASSSSLLAWQPTLNFPRQDRLSRLWLQPKRSLLRLSTRSLTHHLVPLPPCPKRDALASGEWWRKGQPQRKRRSSGRPIPDACWRGRTHLMAVRCCLHMFVMPPARRPCHCSSCGVRGSQHPSSAAWPPLEIASATVLNTIVYILIIINSI